MRARTALQPSVSGKVDLRKPVVRFSSKEEEPCLRAKVRHLAGTQKCREEL